jgi:hypothetical protein
VAPGDPATSMGSGWLWMGRPGVGRRPSDLAGTAGGPAGGIKMMEGEWPSDSRAACDEKRRVQRSKKKEKASAGLEEISLEDYESLDAAVLMRITEQAHIRLLLLKPSPPAVESSASAPLPPQQQAPPPASSSATGSNGRRKRKRPRGAQTRNQPASAPAQVRQVG